MQCQEIKKCFGRVVLSDRHRLRTRLMFRFPKETRYFSPLQINYTGSGGQVPLYSMKTAFLSRGKRQRREDITYRHLVSRVRMTGATFYFPSTPPWHLQGILNLCVNWSIIWILKKNFVVWTEFMWNIDGLGEHGNVTLKADSHIICRAHTVPLRV